jgi:hypothetical protein
VEGRRGFLFVCRVLEKTLRTVARDSAEFIRSGAPGCGWRRVTETRNARFARALLLVSLVQSKKTAVDVGVTEARSQKEATCGH